MFSLNVLNVSHYQNKVVYILEHSHFLIILSEMCFKDIVKKTKKTNIYINMKIILW